MTNSTRSHVGLPRPAAPCAWIASLLIVLAAANASLGAGAQRDHSRIRGFNYTPSSAVNDIDFWRDYDPARVERELDYARRLSLNEARIFLNYVVYEREPRTFLERVRHFVRSAHARGIGTMVVVWDHCCTKEMPCYDSRDRTQWFPNPGPQRLGRDFWPQGEKYVRDLVDLLAGEPGLSFWDIMNEPFGLGKNEELKQFVIHFSRFVRQLDPRTPITIGGLKPIEDWRSVADLVDVISFHDYGQTRADVARNIAAIRKLAGELGKPVINTELGCIARANPYDMTLQMHESEKVGWYIWELMISPGRWGRIHGVFYGDGSVRDPAIAAAVMGCYRSRSPDAFPSAVDQEKRATGAIAAARKWMQGADAPWQQGLAAAEVIANLLEAGELVPMKHPPSARIARFREGAPDPAALRETLNGWIAVLEPEIQR